MDNQLTEILDKLAALNALKERAGTPGEAAAATAAIQRLLFKYNLQMADVHVHVGDKRVAQEYAHEWYDVGQKRGDTNGKWKFSLLYQLALVNFCTLVAAPGSRTAHLIGQPHNLAVVKPMFEYLIKEIKRLTILEWRRTFPDTYGALNNTQVEFSWKRSFRTGAVRIVVKRLWEQNREDLKAAGDSGNALVVQKHKDIENAIAKYVGKTTPLKARGGDIRVDAFELGVEAGKGINLNKQVGTGGDAPKALGK